MNDQVNNVRDRAAAYLRAALPDTPGTIIGDQNFKADKEEKAWYVQTSAETAALLGRQQIKLTLYSRTACRLDKDHLEADLLAFALREIAESDEFAAALGDCAVIPRPDGAYEVDESFHTVSVSYNVFIRG